MFAAITPEGAAHADAIMKTLSAGQFGLGKLDGGEIAALSQLLGKLTPLR